MDAQTDLDNIAISTRKLLSRVPHTAAELGITDAGGGGGGGLSEAQVDARVTAGIASWVGAAPGALDTLAEIATALGDDQTALDGLTSAVAGKADASHTHAQSDVTGLAAALSGKAATAHTHAIADTTGLQAALDSKQASGSYASATHTHAQADITNLVSDLAGKASTSHNHDADYAALAHTHAGVYQPLATVLTNTTAAFTTAQETKLSGIATGATANSADATLLARANHTGTQLAATISDFSTAADARIAAASVNALADVTVTTPSVGQVLKWNGSAWVNDTDATGGGGGSSPSWYGNIYSCRGGCDPHDALRIATNGGSVAATPTNIGIAVARISYFRAPANITVNKIRFYGVGATTNVYRCAIYNADTLARLTAELPFSTAANTWGAAGAGLNLALTTGQLYFIAVSVNVTGTTAGVLCLGPTVAATTGMMATLPKSRPGNLDIDLGFVDSGYAQFTVTNGALPATAPAIAVQSAWTGGFPLLFLDNNNA